MTEIEAFAELLFGFWSYSGGFTKEAVFSSVLPSVPSSSVTVTYSEACWPASMSPSFQVMPSKVPAAPPVLHSPGTPEV